MYDGTTPMQMGVIAHEMGHAMGGLPDLYDTTNTNAGLGAYSLMSGGAWSARPGRNRWGHSCWIGRLDPVLSWLVDSEILVVVRYRVAQKWLTRFVFRRAAAQSGA